MNRIKLLGGFLKGRNIFYSSESIKPTLFIVRKILFSWLESIVYKSRTLDLFGGSGIFSFESISRGSSFSLVVEKSLNICEIMLLNKRNFNIHNLNVINFDVFKWLNILCLIKGYFHSFDIVFIDPPYNSNYLFYCLNFLLKNNYINRNSYIYVESYINFEREFFLFKYKIIKSKIVGNIKFYLIRKI